MKKDKSSHTFAKVKVGCTVLAITILNDENGNPFRIMVEPKKADGLGGCESNLEGMRRLLTLCFEKKIDTEDIIEQLDKMICPTCVRKMIKGEKDLAMSCGKAISRVLKEHTGYEEGK